MIGKIGEKVSNDWKKRQKSFQWLEKCPEDTPGRDAGRNILNNEQTEQEFINE